MVSFSFPRNTEQMLRALEAAYPSEGCGVLLRGGDGTVRALPMRNVYDRYHAQDPVRFPRTSRAAYMFDPKEWLEVCELESRTGEQVVCIVHSHVDVGAYFSQEDRTMAAPDGDPLLPGVRYLVVAVDQGKAWDAAVFHWENGDFREQRLSLPPRG